MEPKAKECSRFYGGHDPEDYTHRVGDPKTELDLHPTSPGYRLILKQCALSCSKKEEKQNLIFGNQDPPFNLFIILLIIIE